MIIPLLTAIILFVNLAGLQKTLHGPIPSIRMVFLETLIILGIFIAITSELLGFLNAITTPGVTVVWIVLLIVNLVVGWKNHLLINSWTTIKSQLVPVEKYEWVYFVFIAIILSITFITGRLSPPNNTDSMLYHMPRVAHWIQSGSLAHYPTAYINQLLYPIWAEETIMTMWLFWGGDSLSFLVQWMSLVGCVVGVTQITKLLGVGRKGQWLSAFFTLSLPVVILQSSSTQNDLVTAFWYINLIMFVVISVKRQLTIMELISFGGVLAVGMLTKATFYPYASILLIAFGYLTIRHKGWKNGFFVLLIIGLFCAILNAGYWIRNYVTFGGIFGSSEERRGNITTEINQRFFLNPLRNIALNLITPSDSINRTVYGWMYFPEAEEQNIAGRPVYDMVFAWNDEDIAGNPLHVLLIVFSFVILVIQKKSVDRFIWFYAGAVSASYFVLCLILQYSPYFVRYEVPFFVASAPIFGFAFVRWVTGRQLMMVTVLSLTICSLPWLLFNKTRPLIALRDYPEPLALPANWITGKTAGSILLEPKATTFFARFQNLRDPYNLMAGRIVNTSCKNIGIRIDSSDPEYAFWWILDAPRTGIHIESINSIPEAARYLSHDYQPCVVVCTICDDKKYRFGLKLEGSYADARLYVK